jgi:dTDP-glucose 4,6-dehydratase
MHTLFGALGTPRALGLAKAKSAGCLPRPPTSTDPKVHPQTRELLGARQPGRPERRPRQTKRYAESMAKADHRVHEVPVKIVRIFNISGPRLRRADGRAVPNFISQAFLGHPLTVYGDGSQTRSLCYVDDLVEGIWRLLAPTSSDR